MRWLFLTVVTDFLNADFELTELFGFTTELEVVFLVFTGGLGGDRLAFELDFGGGKFFDFIGVFEDVDFFEDDGFLAVFLSFEPILK
jgi:hypothetical protein